jgi:hypothetical protein
MQPEDSLLHSQEPTTCPYLAPDQSSPCSKCYSLNIHLNIILPSKPGSSKWSLSSGFLIKTLYSPLGPHMRYVPRPFYFSLFKHPNNNGRGVEIISSSICSFLHYPVTSSLLSPNIVLSTLFSNTLSLRSSLKVSDQASWVLFYSTPNFNHELTVQRGRRH